MPAGLTPLTEKLRRERISRKAKKRWAKRAYRAKMLGKFRTKKRRTLIKNAQLKLWANKQFKARIMRFKRSKKYRTQMHNVMTKLGKTKKQRALMKKTHNTLEYKKKASLAHKRLWKTQKHKAKMFKILRSKQRCLKISKTSKQRWDNPAYKEKLRKIHLKLDNTSIMLKRHRDASNKMWKNPAIKKKHAKIMRKLVKTKRFLKALRKGINRPEVKKKIRARIIRMWANPKFKKRQSIRLKKLWKNLPEARRNELTYNILKANHKRPTQPEKRMKAILDKYFPKQWKYTGGWKTLIAFGGRKPDFTNTNGKKELVEVMGRHWHSPDNVINGVKVRWSKTPTGTKYHYAKYGLKCHCFWSDKISEESVLKRLS